MQTRHAVFRRFYLTNLLSITLLYKNISSLSHISLTVSHTRGLTPQATCRNDSIVDARRLPSRRSLSCNYNAQRHFYVDVGLGQGCSAREDIAAIFFASLQKSRWWMSLRFFHITRATLCRASSSPTQSHQYTRPYLRSVHV